MNNTHLNFKTVRRCNYVDILVLVLLPCVSTVSFHLASVDRCLKLRPILLTTPLCRLFDVMFVTKIGTALQQRAGG